MTQPPTTQTRTNVPAKATPAPTPPIVQVDQLFKQHKNAIRDALPKHITPERMIRIALTELRGSSQLQKCDPLSFLGAMVKASQLGLEPGGSLGHCYLIPYGRECTLQIGYRGMVELARRSGHILSIEARIIYAGDDWEIETGTDSWIKHKPRFKSTDMMIVYAVAKIRDGSPQFDFMPKDEVDHIRDTYSATFRSNPKASPWSSAYDEMAKKTVVRRLFKMLPTSIEIRDAMRVDDDENQQNAKVIDPEYEVMSLTHDPERIGQLQAEGANERHQSEPAAAAAKQKAMEDFTKAVERVRALKGDPEGAMGARINDVLLASTDIILENTGVLNLWRPK